MTIEFLQPPNAVSDESFLTSDGQLLYFANGKKKCIVPCGFDWQLTANGFALLPVSMTRVHTGGQSETLSANSLPDEEASTAWAQWLTEWGYTDAAAQNAILSLYK